MKEIKMHKIMPNYYSKLTCTSFLLVFVIVIIVASYILGILNRTRIASLNEEYDEMVSEMWRTYNDIWDNNYKAFIPVLEQENEKILQRFCRGEDTGYEKAELYNKVTGIFSSVCQQSKWIAGVYFRRTVDNTRYLYLREVGRTKEVAFDLKNAGAMQQNRNLIGAREIVYQTDLQKNGSVRFFGIQSGVRYVARKGADDIGYQVTILYNVDCFDSVLEKYEFSPEAHFLVTSRRGMILYDSRKMYKQGQETLFEGMENVLAEGDSFAENGVVYRKKAKAIKKGDCFAFYTVPERIVKKFRFGGKEGMIILVAAIILAVIGTVMMAISSLIGRRFNELEKGLRQIGMNDLKYRIPIKAGEDEFSKIAIQFNKMCDSLNVLIDKNYVYQVLQQKAEYQALKSSVNPHFLYNSLEIIRELLTERKQDDLADAMLMLSRVLDYQIHGESVATIWMELEALQNYMEFSSVRYRHNFEYTIDFEDIILDYKIPKQIFQPIMENYFECAFRGDGTDYISIQGYEGKEDNRIYIRFCDNGEFIQKEERNQRNITGRDEEHLRLDNIYKRLQILFGESCRVDIRSNAPEPGTSVTLVFTKITNIDT